MRSRVASLALVWMFVSSMLALLPVGGYVASLPVDVSGSVLNSSASPAGQKFLYRERRLDRPATGSVNTTGCIRFGNGFYNVTLIYSNRSGTVNLSHFAGVMVESNGRVLLGQFMRSDPNGDHFLVNVTGTRGVNVSYNLHNLTGNVGINDTNVTLDVRTGRNSSWYRLHQGSWDNAGAWFDINATESVYSRLPVADESSWIELTQEIRLGWNFTCGSAPFDVSVILMIDIEKDMPGAAWTLVVMNHTAGPYNFELRPGFWPAYSGARSTVNSTIYPVSNSSYPSYFFLGLNASGQLRTANQTRAYSWIPFLVPLEGPDGFAHLGTAAPRNWELGAANRVSHWNPITVVNMTFNDTVYIRPKNTTFSWFNDMLVEGNGSRNIYIMLDSYNYSGAVPWAVGGDNFRFKTMFQVYWPNSSGTASVKHTFANWTVYAPSSGADLNVSMTISRSAVNVTPPSTNYFMPRNTSRIQITNLSFPMWSHTFTRHRTLSTVRNNVSAVNTWLDVCVWIPAVENNISTRYHGVNQSVNGALTEYENRVWALPAMALLTALSGTAYPLIDVGSPPRLIRWGTQQLAIGWSGGGNGSSITHDGSQVNWNASMGEGDYPGVVLLGGSQAFAAAGLGCAYGEWLRHIEMYGSHFYLRSSNLTMRAATVSFLDVSWITMWPYEEKMTCMIPSYNVSTGVYTANFTVPASGYYYLNFSINNSLFTDARDEDLLLAMVAFDGNFNISVSPVWITRSGWNTSWVCNKSAQGAVGQGFTQWLRIPRTLTTGNARWTNISLRIGSRYAAAVQGIIAAIIPWCPIPFLDYSEWTEGWIGATDRNSSSRWTGRLLYTSGSFATVRYDEDINGSWDSAVNLSSKNWSYGWMNVSIARDYPLGLTTPSYGGGDNVSVVVYIPLQPGCVQGYWPSKVLVNGTNLTRYTSIAALDAVRQGYYRDGSNRLLYIKTNTTLRRSTIVSIWVGNKPPVFSVTPSAAGGSESASASWSVYDPNGDQLYADVYVDSGSGFVLSSSGVNAGSVSVSANPGQLQFRIRVKDYSPAFYSYVQSSTGWVTVTKAAPSGVPPSAPGGIYVLPTLPTVAGVPILTWAFLILAGVFGAFIVVGIAADSSVFGGRFGVIPRIWFWLIGFAVALVLLLVSIVL